MKKNEKQKRILGLDSFEVLRFNHSSKIIGGGGCGKSLGGGGDAEMPTMPEK